MEFFEKDLERIIYEADSLDLCDRGLVLAGKLKRQLKIGNYGIADLVHLDRPIFSNGEIFVKGVITIIELKKDTISVSALVQALRYTKGITRYLKKNNPSILNYFDIKIYLIGRRIDKNSDLIYAPDIFKNVRFFTYDYTLKGLIFTEIRDYKLIDEGF